MCRHKVLKDTPEAIPDDEEEEDKERGENSGERTFRENTGHKERNNYIREKFL